MHTLQIQMAGIQPDAGPGPGFPSHGARRESDNYAAGQEGFGAG